VVAAEKILSLAGALNAHDRYTRGHGERVRVLTDLIAEELGLPPEDRDRLRWSALLHDIGKLAVHPLTLNKTDKLDHYEWEIIKNHPLEGARLTAPLAGWLGEWANTIAEHHEKFDGTGYPYGLKGDEISLGGRIVAVADCYDTMTTVRSYKASMSPRAARAELAACAGTQFDPRVVRAFLDVSIGRLRPLAGPLAWLGSLPFVGSIPQLGQTVAVLGRVGTASLVVTGAVTTGALATPSHVTAVPSPSQVAVPVGVGPTPGAGSSGSASQPPAGRGSEVPADALGVGPGSTGSSTTSTTVGASGGSGGDSTTLTGPSATAPSTPTGVSVAPGDGDVAVSWSASYDGGSAITSYVVTSYVSGVAQTPYTFSSSATSELVEGLTDGTGYTFTVIATNAEGSSPPSAPSPPATPLASSLKIINGGDLAGRAQAGDQIVVTFSPAPSPSAFCASWSSLSYSDLVGPNVVVQGTPSSSGDDTVTVTDAADCAGGFQFGSIDLGQRGYFDDDVTFGGSVTGCKGGKTTGCSAIHWDGRNTLTITLGKVSSPQSTRAAPSVAVYKPAPALGFSGTISSTKEEHF
jgi:putative nucleotidyltransferase with HDIG domain